MINKQTQTVLKSLLPINNSFVVNYPNMTIVDEFKTMMGRVNLSKLEDSIPEFGIFDGARFLSALDLLDTPEIVLNNNTITASDDYSTMEFITSDVLSLEDCVAKESIISTSEAIPSTMEYKVDTEMLNRLKKASGVFKTMNTLFIVKDDTGVYMKIGSKENFNASKDSYNIKITPELDNSGHFELPVPLENIMMLPAVDYTLKVKYNEKRDAYRIIMDNDLYTFLFTLMK